MLICILSQILFYLNNAKNLRPLTPRIMSCHTHTMAIVLWPQILWRHLTLRITSRGVKQCLAQNQTIADIRPPPPVSHTEHMPSCFCVLCLPHYVQTWCHLQNRKYITHCIPVRGRPSHGHRQQDRQFGKVGVYGFKKILHTDRQTRLLIAILRTVISGQQKQLWSSPDTVCFRREFLYARLQRQRPRGMRDVICPRDWTFAPPIPRFRPRKLPSRIPVFARLNLKCGIRVRLIRWRLGPNHGLGWANGRLVNRY